MRRRTADLRASPGFQRDPVAWLLALVTVVCMSSVFVVSKGTAFLMPGPLASVHGAIKECSACHSKSGSSNVSWVHGLTTGDPLADSKACLSCHHISDTAFNAHNATVDVLKQSTARLTKVAAASSVPHAARAQNAAFPTSAVVAKDLTCATCHQEHQGASFNLNTITNEQCRSCHVVKFDSFDGDHPKFENYPFERRTKIIYDHAGHFNKHYPEVAKKDPSKTIPETCATCHTSAADKRIMAVAPFEKTCAGCHLDQIKGKDRATGPKGIAFLTLPGLDLQALQKKSAPIGEWPDASDATLTPFMKVMISRTDPGRAAVKAIEGLTLQDLGTASDDQIKAVTSLVWEIKALVHALIYSKASDVFSRLTVDSETTLSASAAAELAASLPRDVVISAQQQWLPNLGAEMANRPGSDGHTRTGWGAVIATPAPAPTRPAEPASEAQATEQPNAKDDKSSDETSAPEDVQDPTSAGNGEAAVTQKHDPPPCMVRVLGQCLVSKVKPNVVDKKDVKAKSTETEFPGRMNAGLLNAKKTVLAANDPPSDKATDQSDDLLKLTDEELRATNAAQPEAPTAQSDAVAPAAEANATASSSAPAQAATTIDSGIDAESWADLGGWYRQDYAILYRPTGHKDKFLSSWLTLTGPFAHKGDAGPAVDVFESLTIKDAQGACTKCHSVDDVQGKGRAVNFSPAKVESKQGRFTNFIHEPHFGVVDDRGCLSCHAFEKDQPYLKSYEQGNAQSFASGFSPVKKDVCQSCHNRSLARQDCLTCHAYHVNGATSPIMKTKNQTP